MSWRNVIWIWRRELRDQLRDKRTLFMIAVLPVLMYPLLGTSLFQLAQFMRQTTGRVAVYGAEALDGVEGLPQLIDGDRFEAGLFSSKEEIERLVVERRDADGDPVEAAQSAIKAGDLDVGVCFPSDFAERLEELRNQIAEGDAPTNPGAGLRPTVLSNRAREASQVAQLRVDDVLGRWRQALVQENLAAAKVPVEATQPFRVSHIDVAPKESRDALLWSKLLPFVVFLWALTGAFYPAIDLCAGEKERGTLETLLASPARRAEIVGGKLLTVMTFSIFTALLNLSSLAVTAKLLMSQLSGMANFGAVVAPPPASALMWLVVAVVPMAALFSALSLAFAAYARSTKEGQYYFMPLFLAATPLMLVPTAPGVSLNLGNALVPVMGLVLLLRALIEGQLAEAALYAGPVIAVTAVCCWLAMRWAVSQFNQESVLFRESERFDPKAQLAAMVRRRGDTPSAAAAMACVAGVFLMQTVVRSVMPAPVPGESGIGYFAGVVIATQLLTILLPALAVAWLLARDQAKSLLLRAPAGANDLLNVLLAAAAAVALHPLGQRLSYWIRDLYPLSEAVEAQLAGFLSMLEGQPVWVVLLLMSALPAVCEEIAFRGVVLSGLRKSLGDAGGVLMTAIFFGATHTVLQQSLAAAPLGVVVGVIALRGGWLIPCVVFHACYNALQLLSADYLRQNGAILADWDQSGVVFTEMLPGQLGYATPIAILGGVLAAGLVWAIRRPGRGAPQSAVSLEAAA